MQADDLTLNTLQLNSSTQIDYLGPSLAAGPLPAIFYFALSSQESLCQDPFNQPAAYLARLPLRIFSISLPGHGPQLPAIQAMTLWAQEIASGNNCVKMFIDKVSDAIEELTNQGFLLADRLGVMGLSRGAFIATHLAARVPLFRHIVGFAPLTRLSAIKEFQQIPDLRLTNQLDLENLIPQVHDRQIRFYIGNVDTRVGTRNCFDFIEKAAQAALEHKIRSPQIELIITPSIGQHGHGTSKSAFHAGAQWLAEQLGAIDVI
jgi:esterase FrsA